jgi:hypothetical protein
MKNKFLSIVCVFCIAIIGALNVNLTSTENGDVDLASIVNLSSANAEDSNLDANGNGPYGPPCIGGSHSACQAMIDELEEDGYEQPDMYDIADLIDDNGESYQECESGYANCYDQWF